MTCHSAMISLSKNEYGDMSMSSGSSGNPEAPSTSKLQTSIGGLPSRASENPGAGDTLHAPLTGSADEHAEHSSHIRVLPGSQLRQGRCKASRANRSSNRVSSGNRRHIENKCSEATEMASETLRSNAFVAQCMICKTLTPSEYVLRKLHISSTHMNKGHTHSDFVEILSDLMKKAYPTLPYNDFQCQIGGCRKEYKSQSARRSHVLRVHFRHELCCPLKCSYRSNDFANVNTHLKEDHHLANGYLSIESQQVRSQFSKERAKHNRLLNNLVLVAFPCPVADSGPIHTNTDHSQGDIVQKLMSHIRERKKTFQQAPPNSLRSHIAKPFSDRDSQEMVCSSTSSTDFSDESDVESNDVSAKLDKMRNTNDEDEDDKHGGVIVLD
ncbi:hypothetical protein KIN20_004179 [Parelaphostrongylus tenuis]|uniref:C2H2-type domain-containing protein n=1 Tax=Parelaphostrongylus tenuis TaxID=148309 RepID=A0AAD5MGV6_PARTN|nr:hypothetical protein KIN20_004179 [Parelaphostrongylus tenuis]